MYDYATITKQNQIITQIETTNQNIEKLNVTIQETGTMLAILICLIIIKSFVNVMTGKKG